MENLTVKTRLENGSLDYKLSRNPAGRLELITSDDMIHIGVYPVRAFPISAPEEGLSLLNQDGQELVWIASMNNLPLPTQQLIEEELAQREFMPVIQRINHVASYTTPSTWDVETDKGHTKFILKAEDQIWRLTPTSLLITDNHGVNFLIRDLARLDKHSKKLLDRFL